MIEQLHKNFESFYKPVDASFSHFKTFELIANIVKEDGHLTIAYQSNERHIIFKSVGEQLTLAANTAGRFRNFLASILANLPFNANLYGDCFLHNGIDYKICNLARDGFSLTGSRVGSEENAFHFQNYIHVFDPKDEFVNFTVLREVLKSARPCTKT